MSAQIRFYRMFGDHRTTITADKLLFEKMPLLSKLSADDEHEKNHAEISKLIAETARLNKPMKWYVPVLYATGGAGFVLLAILLARFILIEFLSRPNGESHDTG